MSQGEKDQETSDQKVGMDHASKPSSEAGESQLAEGSEQTSKGDDKTSQQKTAKAGSSQAASSTRKGGAVRFMLALILILLAFGGGGYSAYYYLGLQAQDREFRLNQGIQNIADRIDELEKADQGLVRQQGQFQRALTAAVSDTESQMRALAERLSASESSGPADWTLAEVEYLLRIANQRLITSRDIATATEMLRAADSILKELAYPELISVRRQLAKDMTELQLANQVDVEGLYFQLDALFIEVASLNQFSPEVLQQAEVNVSEEGSRWQRIWQRVVSVLTKYIRIDTQAGEPEYLVSDEQQVIQRLAIQLQLRQAQLALLSSQQSVFYSALTGAADSVAQYYDAPALADQLRTMAQMSVEQGVTDISESIRVLSKVVDQLSKTATLVEIEE